MAGCPDCHTLDQEYDYGLGVVLSGPWILQRPLFAGCAAAEAYLPSKKIAIAVAVASEQSFDAQDNYKNPPANSDLFAAIAARLAPDDAPPVSTQ